MADYDLTSIIDQNRQQSDRRVELHYRVDFTEQAVAAGETAKVFDLPPGYVHERLDPVLRTPEGEAATVDIGTEADPDGFLDGGNMNGTANASVALAGTEAIAPGTYFHTKTAVVIGPPAAAATLNVGVVDLCFVGYMRPTE